MFSKYFFFFFVSAYISYSFCVKDSSGKSDRGALYSRVYVLTGTCSDDWQNQYLARRRMQVEGTYQENSVEGVDADNLLTPAAYNLFACFMQ